jgi:predicted ATPase/class 3 adenylate cyclase
MLFSDMEGSTRLLARLGTTYGDLLSAQRRILRDTFRAHQGTEMGTEGDSFFVVFASAGDAVSACADGQRALASYAWPQGAAPLIRMGLHTGEPTPHEDGYIGLDVHRAARIAASAHGGQVVMSEATRQLVAGQLADASRGSETGGRPGLGVADLGWHRLKDIAEAEHLYQLVIPGLPDTFPPLKSLGNRGSLPRPLTPFIARSAELRDVQDLLSGAGDARMVTVTGPGGVGKTRLALAAAESVADRFPDGVFFVRLAPVTEVSVMWTTIAETLGFTGDGRSPPTFFEHVADLQALLVLDNLEQLPGAAQVVAELLSVAPRVVLLATSRSPLHVLGEREYPLGPLPLPGSLPAGHPQEGAVELFVQYAGMARPDFRLTSENADDVAAICNRLDGLPLALEIAAARARLLSPRALLGRLDSSLDFDAGTAGRAQRHRTLRDTISWSYDLLRPDLQAFFRRMGAFAGGCDLAAISAIASGGADAFDRVAELADAALIRVADGPDGEPRALMLQTVQDLARAALREAGEWDDIRQAHASFYADLVEDLSSRLEGPNALAARDRIEAELENVRAALGWCLDKPADGSPQPPEQLATGLRLCQALSWFWYAFGYTAEGHRWQRRAVAVASAAGGPDLATALHGLALLLLQQGEIAEAKDALTTCLQIRRETGDRSKTAMELNSLGVAYWSLGDLDTGRIMLSESIDIAREIGDESRESTALSNLGAIEVGANNGERAIGLLERALAIDKRLGNAWGCAVIQSNLTGALLRTGRADEAHALLRGHAADIVGLGDIELTIEIIELMAGISSQRGDAVRAAKLLGTAEAMREQAGMPIRRPDAELLGEFLAPARSLLSEDRWNEERLAGRALDVRQALALADLAGSSGRRTLPGRPASERSGGRSRPLAAVAAPPP